MTSAGRDYLLDFSAWLERLAESGGRVVILPGKQDLLDVAAAMRAIAGGNELLDDLERWYVESEKGRV